MSTFFCLKITSFLCLQISPTIASHIPFHIVFCLVFKLLIWKCWKCILAWLWCTELTPIQLSHIFRTFWDIAQEKNRFDALSSQSRQNSHKKCCTWTPFTDNLSFVGNLSKSSLHPNNCAFGITLILHNSCQIVIRQRMNIREHGVKTFILWFKVWIKGFVSVDLGWRCIFIRKYTFV